MSCKALKDNFDIFQNNAVHNRITSGTNNSVLPVDRQGSNRSKPGDRQPRAELKYRSLRRRHHLRLFDAQLSLPQAPAKTESRLLAIRHVRGC